MLLRTEIGIDAAGIDKLLRQSKSAHLAEQIRALREQGLLTLGVVATDDEGQVLGYSSFSPVNVQGEERGWVMVTSLIVEANYAASDLAKDLLFEGLDSLNEFSYNAVVVDHQLEWFSQYGFQEAPNLQIDAHPEQRVVIYPLQDKQAALSHAELTLPIRQ